MYLILSSGQASPFASVTLFDCLATATAYGLWISHGQEFLRGGVISRRPYSRVVTTVMFLFAITIVFVDCAPGATGAGGQKHSTALGR